MRKPLSLSAGIVLLAAGFAAASIATGGSLAAVSHVWTTMTGTTRTPPVTTTGPSGRHGRGVEICVRIRLRHHRFGTRTMIVDFRSLHFLLRRGAHLGPCFVPRRHHHQRGGQGFGFGKSNSHDATTTVVTTTTTTSGPSGFVGKGTTGGQGDDGDDNGGDDNGGHGGRGNGGNWNSFVPSFGHSGHHRH